MQRCCQHSTVSRRQGEYPSLLGGDRLECPAMCHNGGLQLVNLSGLLGMLLGDMFPLRGEAAECAGSAGATKSPLAWLGTAKLEVSLRCSFPTIAAASVCTQTDITVEGSCD